MTPADFETILKHPILKRIESSIALRTSTPLLPVEPLVTELTLRNVNLAEMNFGELVSIFENDGELLESFGVDLLESERRVPREEEFDPMEGNQQPRNREEKTIGIPTGFSTLYACFLRFLLRDDSSGLLDYLKKRRIPKAARFAKRLSRYYADAKR